MTLLFNEQPTISIRRSNSPRKAVKTSSEVQLDLRGSEKLIAQLANYNNPILKECSELLGILASVERQTSPLDINAFRQQLLDGIADFKRKGLFLDYHPSVIEKVCFILCAAFDELILYTSWGEVARWENHSLLSKVFSQRNGGEVFFQLLEQAGRQPAKLVDFLELQYVLIMLGFLGKYRHDNRQKMNELQSELYSTILHYGSESILEPPAPISMPETTSPWRFISAVKLSWIGVLLIISTYCFSEFWYDQRSQSTLMAFSSLDMAGFINSTNNNDLIYTSTPEDLDIEVQEAVSVEPTALIDTISWNIVVASFATKASAARLEKDIQAIGYKVVLNEVPTGVELFIPNNRDLAKAKLLKNEINARFGLNAVIRRSKKVDDK